MDCHPQTWQSRAAAQRAQPREGFQPGHHPPPRQLPLWPLGTEISGHPLPACLSSSSPHPSTWLRKQSCCNHTSASGPAGACYAWQSRARGGRQGLWGVLGLLPKKPEAPEKVQASCCESQALSALPQWPSASSGQIKAPGAGGLQFKAIPPHPVCRALSSPFP